MSLVGFLGSIQETSNTLYYPFTCGDSWFTVASFINRPSTERAAMFNRRCAAMSGNVTIKKRNNGVAEKYAHKQLCDFPLKVQFDIQIHDLHIETSHNRNFWHYYNVNL